MEIATLKLSIDEWNNFYRDSRKTLIKRGAPSIPKKGFAAALLGVRRGGKTFKAIEMSLALPEENVLYYNFEDPVFLLDNRVSGLDALLATASEFRADPLKLLILDEIQNVSGWERWLRKIIDQKNYFIIITGSSAKLLHSELSTSLAGRALSYDIWPLGYEEYLKFSNKTPSSANEHLSTFRNYLTWGGFPEVTLHKKNEIRTKILKQYLDDIVLKDVISRNQIRNKGSLDRLLVFYLTNISSLHSIGSLKNAFQMSADLIVDYTKALCDAFAFFKLERYRTNLKQQSRDPEKIFTIDNGLRHVGSRSASDDTGKLLENIVYLELRRREQEVFYYSEKFEVDFVLTNKYRPSKIIQVCLDLSSEKTRKRELRAIEECLTSLNILSAEIITMNHSETITLTGKQKVIAIPAYEWLCKKKF